jgi:hypothetical protein
VLLALGVETPRRKPNVRDANDMSHSLGLSIKFGVAQHTAHKDGCFGLRDIQKNQAVSRMAKFTPVKVTVNREKWAGEGRAKRG